MQLELTSKQQKYLSNSVWYHATTLDDFYNIRDNGVISDINRDTSENTDFGYGFYLSDDVSKAERFICRLLEFNVRDGIPVILEFSFSPLSWFEDGTYKTKIFDRFDLEFGTFVFENRVNNKNGSTQHGYDSIYGVMSDSLPEKLIVEYRLGMKSRDEVIADLIKPNSMKQLCLHNQALCDTLSISRAYRTDNREELNLNENGI
jgi:hypothetical protein